jgi:hypothetical protein
MNAFYLETLSTHRLEMLAARDESYFLSRGRQARAEVSAHGACTHNGDTHLVSCHRSETVMTGLKVVNC